MNPTTYTDISLRKIPKVCDCAHGVCKSQTLSSEDGACKFHLQEAVNSQSVCGCEKEKCLGGNCPPGKVCSFAQSQISSEISPTLGESAGRPVVPLLVES